MASSWEYPSLNRMSDMTPSDRIGEFERLPSRIDSNKQRNRFEPHSKDNKRGQGKFSYGNRKNNKGHNASGHKRQDSLLPKDEHMDYSQQSSHISNLPLPLPGTLSGNESIDKPSENWDQVPLKNITGEPEGDWKPSHISNPVEEINLSEEEIKEELFPPNKIALLQENLDACPDLDLIGLEYIIEVQHNSVKNLAPLYYCLLCDEKTKDCEKTSASLEQVKLHLRSVAHKVHYIEAYFPTLKKCLLNKIDGGVKSSVYRETISGIGQKITSNFGKMNIKIVIGLKLFERRQQEIKKMIDNSTHFRENKEFLGLILGNNSLANSYEKAFSDFEAELRKKNNRDRHRPHNSYNDPRNRGRNRYRSRRSRSRSRSGYDRKSSSSRNSYERDSSELGKNKNDSKSEESVKKSVFVDILANRKDHGGSQRRNSSPTRGRYSNSYGRASSNSKDRKSSRGSPDSYESMNRSVRPSVEKQVEKYIEKEKVLNEILEKERKEYLNFPHTHRNYNEEWENFYVNITSKRGITDPEIINQEWVEHWKAFFFQSFDIEVRKRKDQLLIDHHITGQDLDKYYVNKAKSLEEQLENKISATKPTGKVVGYYTNTEQSRPGPSTNQQKRVSSAHCEDDDKEVTVISTFRLLSALESILDDLGPTVIRLLAQANSMEVNEGFGSSSKMVNEQEVFTVFWKAREKLDYKIKNQLIDGNRAPTSQVCIKNMNSLIKKSKCELPQEMQTDANNESSVKAAIAKTVVEQFVAQGKPITESQLASIVEMEYERVKDSIPTSSSSGDSKVQSRQPIDLTELNKKPEMELVPPNSEEDLERMTCHQLADIFKRFREFNKITRCRILDYMKKIEKTNPARVTEMKKIIHSKT